MIAFAQWAHRNWRSFRPVEEVKKPDALRLGLLGASKIAPFGVIIPAKSHPEVIVAAVAARDEKRAQAYATLHGIPNVHASYQALLDDPTVDAVYIALPISLHYEWAMKALKAGKHVLLEKPSASNAVMARNLFRHPRVAEQEKNQLHGGGSLILLDAVHVRFHPAWQKFLSLIESPIVAEVISTHHLPKGSLPNDDIRFQYALAGGCLMDFGSYNVQTLRQVFGTEPVECITAHARLMPTGLDQNIDQAFSASWRFPNGGIGSIISDFAAMGGYYFPWLTDNWPAIKLPMCSVKHREQIVQRIDLQQQDMEEAITKTVTIWNLTFAWIWHRIDVVEEHVLRHQKDGHIERRWTERKYVKKYDDGSHDASWTTYRHQLEQFVNKVRGRRGSGVWVDGEDSIQQMEMIDGAYKKAGLPVRPDSSYVA